MRAPKRSGALVLATVLAAACGESERDTNDTHTPGTGGMPGAPDAGSATTGGSAGALGGSGGASGTTTGGSAGTTGSGGSSGRDASPTDPSRAGTFALAAAVIGSCLQDDGINRNNGYLWYAASIPRLWARFGQEADCLATHGGGCGAVEACLGWSWIPGSATCTSGCQGDVFRACAEYDFTVDCSRLGLRCDEVAVCSSETAETCDPDAFAPRCTPDGTPEVCDDGAVFRGADCAALGLACESGQCMGSGAACTAETDDDGTVVYDGLRCQGDTLVACVGGREHSLDCASLDPDFTCQSRDDFRFCGLAAECLPALDQRTYGDAERCEGNTIVFCNAGRVERVDCTSLGFTGCDVDSEYGCTPGFFD